jgi:hypothetical protein
MILPVMAGAETAGKGDSMASGPGMTKTQEKILSLV